MGRYYGKSRIVVIRLLAGDRDHLPLPHTHPSTICLQLPSIHEETGGGGYSAGEHTPLPSTPDLSAASIDLHPLNADTFRGDDNSSPINPGGNDCQRPQPSSVRHHK